MLSELYIENLAVIKQATIPFTDNFNVFTGETGAGKSILINGINAVLGQRANKDIVRTGCDKASVSALFKTLSSETKQKLDEFGISYDEDELLVTREISADGGSSARINSKISSVSVLREIGSTLIDIHGQHDNAILMYPEKHLELVDAYGNLEAELNDYQASFKALQETARKIKKLTEFEREKKEKLDIIRLTVEEIGALEIKDINEDKKIESEFSIADNRQNVSSALERSLLQIKGNDDEQGVIGIISGVIKELDVYADIIPEFSKLIERLNGIKIEADDICGEFDRINNSIEFDAERYAFIEARREKLISIKRKYGPELENVIERYNNAVCEANDYSNNADEIKKLAEEKSKLLLEVSAKAERLSQKRAETAEKMTCKISNELEFLNMPDVKLIFEHKTGKLTMNGMDSMEMFISVNAGELPKPIAKIASGGELSRIMLAIKNVTAEKEDVPTLIFDEIDTGVSGRAAQKIGIKLREISKHRQIICVTHLSQIAVMADNHLLIEKSTDDGRTYTSVTVLDKNKRVKEIARIICGDNITDTALKNAAEMLENKDNSI